MTSTAAVIARATRPEPLAQRPDWVVGVAAVVLMLIFGAVVCAYLGVFQRKSSKGYGWWW